MPIKYKDLDEYFLKKTIRDIDECWIWNGCVDSCGYGNVQTIHWAKKFNVTSAHRLSYCHHIGEIPEGLCVIHKCDKPRCVNPEHLYLGTHEDNMKDMGKKGRARESRGILNPMAKLSKKDARFIFEAKGIVRRSELAKKYKVCLGTINNIMNGITHYLD